MAPKRTPTSAAHLSAMTQCLPLETYYAEVLPQLLEAQAASMANADNTNRNTGPRETPVARKCSYKEFMSYQPFNFKGTEGTVGLIRWFERTESVFLYSSCTEDCKVKFSTGTLTEEALNPITTQFAQPIGIEEAYKITWSEFKQLLIKKYCPRTEIKKMEDEFYNLTVKGNDLKTYIRRFQELAVFYPQLWCQILRNSLRSSSGITQNY
ncbi:reverse transcriptase domain-containing protein [Tanacetum coccineum]